MKKIFTTLSILSLFVLFITSLCFAQPTRRGAPIERGSPLIPTVLNALSTDNNLYPSTSNTYDLGNSTYYWRRLYVQGGVYPPAAGLFIDGYIYPLTDNTRDLGSATYSFNDIFTDGTIYADAFTAAGSSAQVVFSDYPANLIDGDIYPNSISVQPNLEIDGAVYVGQKTASSSALFIKQSDGGCSKCGVDAAGTTWSCVNITCSTAGM